MFTTFSKEESGATLVEYGIALILAIIVGGAALSTLADQTGQNMGGAEAEMDCWEDDSCTTQ